ncbi:SsrA-binding protein SmpB [bacterium NHP-B]|nr:SsrA-binding protein SmpB [bacterium NHP-B]
MRSSPSTPARPQAHPRHQGCHPVRKILLRNRTVHHNYDIIKSYEAGLVLKGWEVKSLRQGQGAVKDSFAKENQGTLMIENLYIPPYKNAPKSGEGQSRRPRNILLHAKEINKLKNAASNPGTTIAVIQIYLTPKGKIKAEIGIASGKTKHDKREALKKKDWQRQKQRLLKKDVRF